MTKETGYRDRLKVLPPIGSSATRVGERGDYLSFVEALQGCLLARDCAVSTMRFKEASVEESSECC